MGQCKTQVQETKKRISAPYFSRMKSYVSVTPVVAPLPFVCALSCWKCSPAAAVVAPRPFVCALSCWKCSPAPTLGDIYRPVYEIQGSRHKFLAAQPHMPRAGWKVYPGFPRGLPWVPVFSPVFDGFPCIKRSPLGSRVFIEFPQVPL